jgi:hypothetical protein
MSHFVECQTEFHDSQALIAALIECGFPEPQIDVHEQAMLLYGYHGNALARRPHQAFARVSNQAARTSSSRRRQEWAGIGPGRLQMPRFEELVRQA